jgi:carbonic anhydrase/acetyltransferase-like protein (isoleucine patch superfamily)
MPIYSLKDRQPRFPAGEWYVAPTAALIGSVVLGNQSTIWFNVVIRADNELITIGERTNVQDGSVLHADPGRPLVLGANVTIGHKVMLHGCEVGDGSLIGMNAVLLNGSKVGAGSILGAGSLLPEGREIPPGVLALGAPARVIRPLTPEDQAGLLVIAEGYVARGVRYRAELAAFTPT